MQFLCARTHAAVPQPGHQGTTGFSHLYLSRLYCIATNGSECLQLLRASTPPARAPAGSSGVAPQCSPDVLHCRYWSRCCHSRPCFSWACKRLADCHASSGFCSVRPSCVPRMYHAPSSALDCKFLHNDYLVTHEWTGVTLLLIPSHLSS
jgi:hypothetical protein